jgi:hypothetical protein
MKLTKEDLLAFINSRRWLYASEQGFEGKLILFYYGIQGKYWVVQSNGFQVEETVLYHGDDVDKAVGIYNEMTF